MAQYTVTQLEDANGQTSVVLEAEGENRVVLVNVSNPEAYPMGAKVTVTVKVSK